MTDSLSSNRDKYGRLLRYVYMTKKDGSTGDFIDEKMVQDGYAYAYTIYPFQYSEQFKQDQKTAQKLKRGLWSSKTCNGKRWLIFAITWLNLTGHDVGIY